MPCTCRYELCARESIVYTWCGTWILFSLWLQGLVVACGPGARTKNGDLISMNVAVGDKVLLPEWGGNAIKVEDKEYHLFRDSDILAKME